MILFYLLFFLLIIYPLGQLTLLPVNFGLIEVNFYLVDIVAGLIVIVWSLNKIIAGKFKLKKDLLIHPIIAFASTALFSLLLNINFLNWEKFLVSSFYLVRWVVFAGFYFVVKDIVKENKFKLAQFNFKDLFLLSSMAGVVFGLVQYLFFPDIRSLIALGWDPHYYRIVGTFLDPSFIGCLYVFILVYILVKFKKVNFLFVITYLALALTYSRSSYLAYLAAMAVFAFFKKRPKFFVKILAIGILTVLVLPRPGGEGVYLRRQSTVWARFNNWKNTLQIIKDRPVFGVGFNSLRYVKKRYDFLSDDWRQSHSGAGADCSLLFVWATTGVTGLISYLWLLYRMYLLGIKKKPVLIPAVLTALIVHSFFNNTLFYNWLMLWMWVVLAI